MAKSLKVRYDKVGDILYIDTCLPYVTQKSEEIGDEVIARLNPVSEEVENLEILLFSKWLEDSTLLNLPIAADFKLAG